jgi:hypothetical protein
MRPPLCPPATAAARDVAVSEDFDPLIWTVVYGADDYFQCLAACLESLVVFGRYTGKVCLFSDRTVSETLEFVPDELGPGTTVLPCPQPANLMSRYDCVAHFSHIRGPLLHVDPDVIFDAPVAPILRQIALSPGICVSSEAEFYPQFRAPAEAMREHVGGQAEWFGLSLYLSDPRFSGRELPLANAGIVGARDNAVWARLCGIAKDVALFLGAEHFARWTDQAVLNYALAWVDAWDSAILTRHVTFTSSAPDSTSPGRGLCHFLWADGGWKYPEMCRYVEARMRSEQL